MGLMGLMDNGHYGHFGDDRYLLRPLSIMSIMSIMSIGPLFHNVDWSICYWDNFTKLTVEFSSVNGAPAPNSS